MTVPAQPVTGEPQRDDTSGQSPVNLCGDAYAVFTAPFYPQGNPLERTTVAPQAIRPHLLSSEVLVERDLPMESILKGTLTFQLPQVDEMVTFAARDSWLASLRDDLPGGAAQGAAREELFNHVELSGVLFADGYGSVAYTLRAPRGWEDRRSALLAAIGREGRDDLAEALRLRLLPELARLLRPWSSGEEPQIVLPYFNLTYVGNTTHPVPGEAALDNVLRPLLYPDTPLPLRSRSPWRDEFLYAGYAYMLLASDDPVASMRKLTLLLHVLNDSYARLATISAAADDVLRSEQDEGDGDLRLLAHTERRLRAEYQRLITPTFSFDHHALRVRDAILQAWDVPKLQSRADSLMAMLRRAVEFQMSEEHARRVDRLNRIILVLAFLSVISTVEAAASLWELL